VNWLLHSIERYFRDIRASDKDVSLAAHMRRPQPVWLAIGIVLHLIAVRARCAPLFNADKAKLGNSCVGQGKLFSVSFAQCQESTTAVTNFV